MYNIGDYVWIAGCTWAEDYVPCPVCYGNKEVTVILGNGEKVSVQCGYCAAGLLGGSTGKVKGFGHRADVKKLQITEVRTSKKLGETKVEYISDYRVLKPKDCCNSMLEATFKSEQLVKKAEESEIDRAFYQKGDRIKKIPHTVGYHKKQIQSFEKSLERHKACIRKLGSLPKKGENNGME